jgi:hypothetical protein
MKFHTAVLLPLMLVFPLLSAADISCPPPPSVIETNRDINFEVTGGVGVLKNVKAGDISVKTQIVAKNIFEKFPNIDKLIMLQMMSSTYCQMLSNSKMTDKEKLEKWERFQEGVLSLPKSATQAPTATQTPPSGVTLNGTYPGEEWNIAKKADYSWLAGEWCYPSLRNFISRFKVEGNQLFRQNEGSSPKHIKTDWIPITAHRSNRNVLRFSYPKGQDWPVDFLEFEPKRTSEWREYTRSLNDDGSVSSNKKTLALSCSRCSVDKLGAVYNCKE